MHIDEIYDIFEGVDRVIDICAAPGSWTQLITRRLIKKGLKYEDYEKVGLLTIS